jgi:hypothetical protein
MSSRRQNELRFTDWQELPGGGRLYQRRVPGRTGWSAIHYKEVDSSEVTVRFWQEIYDEAGHLREIHEKFPVDLGHRKV